jgi:hypothetical protein
VAIIYREDFIEPPSRRPKLPRVTAHARSAHDAEPVVEIGLSLPITGFYSAVANAEKWSRICGRPARICLRASAVATRSVLSALGYIADDAMNTLWPAQAVAVAHSRDFVRAVRAVEQLTEPEERQQIWKPMRRANR